MEKELLVILKRLPLKFLLTSLMIAAGYCALGRLGLYLAIPPGYATIMWPSAGLALGALLIWGNRYWFAVWLGSFGVNLWIAFGFATGGTTTGIAICTAALIAVGAVLQAWVGAVLIRRYISYPNALYQGKKILIFTLLAGPVTGLVNASWSNVLLWLFYVIPADTFLQSWGTWWIGDSIGLLVFTPLMLVLFGEPRVIWKKRLYSVATPLCFLLLISVIAFMVVKRHDLEESKDRFADQVASANLLFQRRIYTLEDALGAIRSFFYSSENVTRKEFRQFVSQTLQENSSIQAFSWNPVVSHAQRDAYTQLARRSGFPGFEFRQIKQGRLMTDQERLKYYVIYYLEPYVGNESALGLNLASSHTRLTALNHAAKENRFVATEKIQLVQNQGDQPGVILFLPVYTEKTKQLDGFVSGVFRIKTLISSILFSNESKMLKSLYLKDYIQVKLLDRSAPKDKQLLYESGNKKTVSEAASDLMRYLSVTYRYRFGERDWQLIISPTETYLLTLFSWGYFITLIFFLFFFSLVVLFLFIFSGQNFLIREEVDRKTQDLSRMELHNRLILESVGEGVVGIDNQGIVTFINSEASRLLGYEKSEILHQDLHRLTHYSYEDGSIYEKDVCSMHTVSEKQVSVYNQKDCLYRKNGTHFPVEYSKVPIRTKGVVTGVVISFRDISIRKRAEAQMQFLEKYSKLTKLPNRKSFQEYIARTMLRIEGAEEGMAVCLLNIDDFRVINEVYGHDFGDEFLKFFAKKLKKLSRETDYLAHLGLDEFGLCIEGIHSPSEVDTLLRRYLNVSQSPIVVNTIEVRVSLSIGFSLYFTGTVDSEILLKHADIAKHKAKEAKNVAILYSDELSQENERRITIASHLRQAIQNNEFYLVYQPQVNLLDSSISGVEVLLRWDSAALGSVPPDEFIPIAESSGLMYEIGDWILAHSLKQFSEWCKSYPNFMLYMNINCSILQFQHSDFFDRLQELIAHYHIRGSQLIVEATETVLMERVEEVSAQLEKLNGIGVRVAIDDFGTGYSSLSYLKKLPISILKIDKSFVSDITEDHNDVAIVNATIQLAKSMGLDVIAEGVETKAQADCLIEMGCTLAQGFYLSKPVSEAEISALLKKKFL